MDICKTRIIVIVCLIGGGGGSNLDFALFFERCRISREKQKNRAIAILTQQTMKREAPDSSNSDSKALPQKKYKEDKIMSEEKMDVTATADGK